MTLKLINCLTKQVYFIENLVENSKSTDLFYCFDLKLEEDLPEGEYNYILMDDSVEVVQGILQIGDYVPEKQTYNNSNETIVYEG